MIYFFSGRPSSHAPHIAQWSRKDALTSAPALADPAGNFSISGPIKLFLHHSGLCASRLRPSIARDNNISGDIIRPHEKYSRDATGPDMKSHGYCPILSKYLLESISA